MTFDYERQLLEDRRRKYLQDSLSPMPQGRMAGNVYIAPNALEYLAAGLKNLGGLRGEQMAGQELKDLESNRLSEDKKRLQAYAAALKGNPETGQAGDSSAAYEALIGARSPELQKLGLQGLTDSAKEQAAQARNERFIQALKSAANPQEAIAAGVPYETAKNYYEARNLGKDKVTFKDIDGELVGFNEYGERPAGIQSIQRKGDPFSDLLVRNSAGQLVENAPLAAAKQRIASAGASRNNVSINMPDKKFYEGLGSAVSGQIEKGFEQAQSAAQVLNNANQIAANMDKAIIGPFANQRLSMAQLAQSLGVGGKNNAEVLQNTRNVMQGLARQELAAAQGMKGQGQITENERAILRKAEAGQINDFTKPELQTFLSAIRKTSKARIAAHEKNMQNLSADPQARTILPYLQVQAPEDFGVKPQGGAAAPVKFLGFE